MKATVQHAYGGPESLRYEDAPRHRPRPAKCSLVFAPQE